MSNLYLDAAGKPICVTDSLEGPNGITSKPLDRKPNRTIEQQAQNRDVSGRRPIARPPPKAAQRRRTTTSIG
jgi:hypothetical protein